MTDFAELRLKVYHCSIDDGDEKKKEKSTKSVIKRNVDFKDYKNCLEENLLQNEINHLKMILK